MVCKMELSGRIRVLTGLHIGGLKGFSAIGAVDSTVIRDSRTHFPMIPGSSLKGKMRTLLQRHMQDGSLLRLSWDQDKPEVKRLFGGKQTVGSGDTKKERIIRARLQFFDCFVSSEDIDKELVEIKAENTINRLDSVANPRSIERINRGIHFDFRLSYEMPFDDAGEPLYDEIRVDFKNIYNMIALLESDYLGGSGSRGYGRIAFEDLTLKKRFGTLPQALAQLEEATPWEEAVTLLEGAR